VTQEGILNLETNMMERWRDELQPSWSDGRIPKGLAEGFWGTKTGAEKKSKKLK